VARETIRTFLKFFKTFFQNPKNMTFYVFELLHTFSRTLFHAMPPESVHTNKSWRYTETLSYLY